MDIYATVTDRIIAQIEQDILEEDFIDVTSRVFSEMRLMTEGAIIVYEEDTQPLCRLTCDDDDNNTILNALNDIGLPCTLSAPTYVNCKKSITRSCADRWLPVGHCNSHKN